jgi:hypothetical protein
MEYSLELIALPEEADNLIKTAKRDKRIFEHRKESLELRTVSSVENASQQQFDLAEAQAQLTAATATIASLPEGPKKEEEITKKMALEVRIRKINESGSKTGAVALIEQEYDSDLLERQIAGIDEFITAVTARKAAL